MTRFFKSKASKKVETKVVPRTMDAIQAAYTQLCAQAGAAQYQIFVQEKELERLNDALIAVNQEAAERQKLDAEAKAKEQPADTVQKEA